MAYWKLNSGGADYSVPAFRGLLQYGDDLNAAPIYATDVRNVTTTGGVLQPAAEPQLLPWKRDEPVKTMAALYRRWPTSGEKVLLYQASGGKIYQIEPESGDTYVLPLPDDIERFQSDEWSWVAYEINPGTNMDDDPIDVLLMSNPYDGMIMINPNLLSIETVPTPKKYGVIERHAERIWGGAILDDPDMLQYSRPFDPFDWTGPGEDEPPEDGAGDIQQPSWDGDSFTALKTFGSQLIAFKKNRVWRILGTDPGEYAFKEQFGGGAPYANTVVVDVERIFAITDFGPVVYDGMSIAPYQQDATKAVFDRVTRSAMAQSCACKWRDSYYVSLPLDGSEINNAVLVFNTVDGTWLLRDDLHVEAWLPTDDALYFTSSTTPGRMWAYVVDSWKSGVPTSQGSTWVSPWCDLSYKRYTKGGFTAYMTLEQLDRPVTLEMTVQTERGEKTKQIVPKIRNGEAQQITARFNLKGRRFRWKLSAPINTPCWRIKGGILIVADTAAD